MTTTKVVLVANSLAWFIGFASIFALVADWMQGVTHSDLAITIPMPYFVMALLGQTVYKAISEQQQRIDKLEGELWRQRLADSEETGASEGH
jgi:hypothetical protein